MPDANKIVIPKVEYYITNVCNLTCDGCNRFNDHHFTGGQRWADYESTYQAWAEHIDIIHPVILGGEPLLNPDIIKWATGLQRILQRRPQILSNGFRINYVPGLYELLLANIAYMQIGVHNINEADIIFTEINKFLKGTVTRNDSPPGSSSNNDWLFTDSNNVSIGVQLQDKFTESALIPISPGKWTLNNSDIHIAHSHCPMAIYKSYHFIRGKLYKCGPAALFPEFDQQHHLELSDADRELLYSYKPLAVEDFEEHGAEFLRNIDNPIAQCKFCPAYPKFKQIFSVRKGTK